LVPLLRRALATTVAGLALTAGAVVVAGPAAATGEGCIGLPSVPAAFVCVVSLTPENAVPTVTTANVPVTVPEVCYYVSCTGPKTVQVPVPGATLNSGYVAVVRYKNVDYPIGVGTAGAAYQAILDAEQDVLVLADGVYATVLDTYGSVSETAATWVQYVQDTAPSVSEIRGLVNDLRDTYVYPVTRPWTDYVNYCKANLNNCINVSI
jgi:hypothetical protein